MIEAVAARAAVEDRPFDVWEGNRVVFDLFSNLATQWRRAGTEGQAVGLDYAAVEATARMTRVKLTPERFADLQAMEVVAIGVFAEAARERRDRA